MRKKHDSIEIQINGKSFNEISSDDDDQDKDDEQEEDEDGQDKSTSSNSTSSSCVQEETSTCGNVDESAAVDEQKNEKNFFIERFEHDQRSVQQEVYHYYKISQHLILSSPQHHSTTRLII